MMCSKCGAEINASDNFCEECGASLKVTDVKPMEDEWRITVRDSGETIYDGSLAAVSNTGRRHPINEDACSVLRCTNGDCLLIVADGVSSADNSVSASRRAVEIIKKTVINNTGSVKELITRAILAADSAIKELTFETRKDGIYGPETTVVTALVQNDTAFIAWVGDSRAYVLNGDVQEQLTVDDSWIEMVVSQGTMSREQASMDRLAHCITQVLGMYDQQLEVHVTERKLKDGDMLILCSDGLWNYFQEENDLLKVIKSFGESSDALSICEYLVSIANKAGGHDNITVALLKYSNKERME